jgi:hypothetical protein
VKSEAEEALDDCISKVKQACIAKQTMHLNQLFTDSPGQSAIVAYFAVCPDEIAKELHSFIDSTMKEFWHRHGIH